MSDIKAKLNKIHEKILSTKAIDGVRSSVVFMSDFGQTDAVATCHEMVLRVDENLTITDFNHNVEPFNIEHGSVLLQRSKDFRDGTVFFCVVDPGVGTEKRDPVILKTKERDFTFIGPNNGLFSDVIELFGIKSLHKIIPEKSNPKWQGFTFDGRDLFAPVAGIIASLGDEVLPLISEELDQSKAKIFDIKNRIKIEKNTIKTYVLAIDQPFGNIWTFITQKDLEKIGIKKGDLINLRFKNRSVSMPFKTAFGEVEYANEVAYLDSRNGIGNGFLAFGINQKNFSQTYSLSNKDEIWIEKA